MKRLTISVGVVGVLIAITAIVVCNWPRGPRGVAEPISEPIRIGAILPLTGSLSWFGENASNAAVLLQDQLNDEYGKDVVEIRLYDSRSLPKDGLTAYAKMKADGIDLCYVSLDPVAKALLPRIEEDDVLMFVGSVDNEFASASRNVFRLYYGFSEQSDRQLRFLRDSGFKSVAMVLRDAPHIRKYAEERLGTHLRAAGVEITAIEVFPPDTKDFRDILSRVLVGNPSSILMSEYGMLYDSIFRQLRELSDAPPVVVCGLGMLNVAPENYGLFEGTYFTGPAYLATKNGAFASTFEQRFGRQPSYEAYYAYDSLKTCFLSARTFPREHQDVRERIINGEFPGVSQERIRFTPEGDLHTDVVLLRFRNGVTEPAEPSN